MVGRFGGPRFFLVHVALLALSILDHFIYDLKMIKHESKLSGRPYLLNYYIRKVMAVSVLVVAHVRGT